MIAVPNSIRETDARLASFLDTINRYVLEVPGITLEDFAKEVNLAFETTKQSRAEEFMQIQLKSLEESIYGGKR